MRNAEKVVRSLLARAGVVVNGSREWDIRVQNPRFYRRVLSNGSLGLGESCVDGWWQSERIDELVCRVMRANPEEHILALRSWLPEIRARFWNLQRHCNAFRVGECHYDLGNESFEAMLDESMTYSCGYWAKAADLRHAQIDKLDLVCQQAGTSTRHARARHRLRLGQFRAECYFNV